MAILLIILVLSGWGLYYLGSESWREATSVIHWVLGFASAAWLPFHIWRGRLARPQARETGPPSRPVA